jgi:hypothetical protein
VLLLEDLSPLTPGYEELPEDRAFAIRLSLTVASLRAIGEVQTRWESSSWRERSLSNNRG